jgi:hypothetical protein
MAMANAVLDERGEARGTARRGAGPGTLLRPGARLF